MMPTRTNHQLRAPIHPQPGSGCFVAWSLIACISPKGEADGSEARHVWRDERLAPSSAQLSYQINFSLKFLWRFYRFTTYQDARRVRLVDGLETNILRVSPVNEGYAFNLIKYTITNKYIIKLKLCNKVEVLVTSFYLARNKTFWDR